MKLEDKMCENCSVNEFIEENLDNRICFDCGLVYCNICETRIQCDIDFDLKFFKKLGMETYYCDWCNYG